MTLSPTTVCSRSASVARTESSNGVELWRVVQSAAAKKSRYVHMTKGRSAQVELSRKVLYELDGGDRQKKKSFRVEVQPGASPSACHGGNSTGPVSARRSSQKAGAGHVRCEFAGPERGELVAIVPRR